MTRRTKRRLIPNIACVAAVVWSCSCADEGPTCDSLGEGTLAVDVNLAGLDGMPTEDGWSLAFDRFVVHLDELDVRRAGCGEGLQVQESAIFDLAADSPSGLGQRWVTGQQVPEGLYDEVSFGVSPARGGTAAGSVDPATLAMMVDEGWSLFVSGSAQKGGSTLSFAWGLSTSTSYRSCAGRARVPLDGMGRAELTFWGDHLFLNRLFAPQQAASFDRFAESDADGDGVISMEEVGAADISSDPRYRLEGEPVERLSSWLYYLSGTLGHVDGEGHCETTPR